MENNMNKELEALLRAIAKGNNIPWEDAKFFFNMGFYEGKIRTLGVSK